MLQKIINRLDQSIKFLQPLLLISNCHMVDFFVHNVFVNHIPLDIRQEIENMGPEEIINSILNKNFATNSTPSLEKFISDCLDHTLPKFNDICLTLQDFQLKLIDLGCQNLSGLRLDIFMTSKKSHEVEIMSEISAAVCEISKIEHVVDIGDGKGYLSSALALNNGFKVLGIDSSDINTKSAANRIKKLNKIWKNNPNNIRNTSGSDLYKQTTKYVTEDTDLTSLVLEYFSAGNSNISLVGLHTCGDLSSNCLKIFLKNSEIKTICNVGCCYHLISENFEENSGFPVSKYLQKKHFSLGRNARMLSCQSLDRILDKKELPSKILFYRSLLQILILKYCPEMKDKPVGRFGEKTTNFTDYVQKAFQKFDANIEISEQELFDLYFKYESMEKYLQIFYILRAYIAPIIESVILLDRLLFLFEQNVENSFLIQLFDPVISPRCYGIVAFKNDCL